ncbi:MAG: hypothetical protein WC975_01130 [Phycisphaerae bacterium]
MKYKDALKQAMETLAADRRVIFIGYNIAAGSRAYGTLADVTKDKCIEMPVAENLMADLAIGMAMEGFKPVLFFERHDFMLNASDALVNHLDKMKELSGGAFTAPVIIRAAVGGTTPIYPGLQHIQNFTDVFRKVIRFPIYELKTADDILRRYSEALEAGEPVMLVEERNLYDHDSKSHS